MLSKLQKNDSGCSMVRKHPSENNGRGGSPSGPKIQVRSTVWVDRGGFAAKMGRLRRAIPTWGFRWGFHGGMSQELLCFAFSTDI
jgi:hypothetical protein